MFIPLQGWLLIQISVTPSDMDDGLFTVFKHRFINFYNIVMITILMDDYLVVMAYVNQYCLDTFACLELDANLPMLINLTWLINMLNST
jgi:hypothetical protein